MASKGLVVKVPVAGKGKLAVMPQVNLSDIVAAGNALKIVFVDGSTPPNPIVIDPSTVSTTMTNSDPTVVTAPGADSLHYTVTVPAVLASGNTVITESAGATYKTPPAPPALPGPFSATLPILCNLSPPPASPVDIQIQIGA
jgi:hypothetical protein